MIDFHNHIIPGVDDGAKTIEMSIDMLKEASSQGITEVVSTIHFQHPKMDGKNTNYSFIKNKCNELQEALDANNINIKIHIAAEVFYLPNLIGCSREFIIIKVHLKIIGTVCKIRS